MKGHVSHSIHPLTLNLIVLLSATTIGVLCGLLLAPRSGSRTRRRLQRIANEACERIEGWTEDARETVEQFVKQGKKAVGA